MAPAAIPYHLPTPLIRKGSLGRMEPAGDMLPPDQAALATPTSHAPEAITVASLPDRQNIETHLHVDSGTRFRPEHFGEQATPLELPPVYSWV